jgi:hypothetical protein
MFSRWRCHMHIGSIVSIFVDWRLCARAEGDAHAVSASKLTAPFFVIAPAPPVQDSQDPDDDGNQPSFSRKAAPAVAAAATPGEGVFVPNIPKSDTTMAMLENAVKGEPSKMQHRAWRLLMGTCALSSLCCP